MTKETDNLHKAGLMLGLASFIISNAAASPFQAELLKTGYENPPSNEDIITPNGFQGATAEDVTPGTTSGNTPHYDEPVSAADVDPFSDGAKYIVKPVDGKCGMCGCGE